MAVQVVCYEIFQYLEKTSIQVSAEGKREQSEISAGSRIWDKEPASGQQIDG